MPRRLGDASTMLSWYLLCCWKIRVHVVSAWWVVVPMYSWSDIILRTHRGWNEMLVVTWHPWSIKHDMNSHYPNRTICPWQHNQRPVSAMSAWILLWTWTGLHQPMVIQQKFSFCLVFLIGYPTLGLNPTQVDPSPCAKGTFSKSEYSQCDKCTAGSYTPSESMSECLLCAKGHYAARKGQSHCNDKCPAGYIAASEGRCSFCGWYCWNCFWLLNSHFLFVWTISRWWIVRFSVFLLIF